MANLQTAREKIVPATQAFQDQWEAFRRTMDVAAQPFTDADRFPLPPFVACSLKGGLAELDRAMSKVAVRPVAAEFQATPEGRIQIRLSWVE